VSPSFNAPGRTPPSGPLASECGQRPPGERLAREPPSLHTRRVAKTYTRDEADEILRRALAMEAAEGIRHDDLVAAAREVGIPAEAIEQAAEHVAAQGPVVAMAERIRHERRRAFFRHLLTYVVVNAGLFAIDWLGGGAWFFYFPLILWGIVLAVIALHQLAPDPERLTRQAERRIERERRRASRREARTRRRGRTVDHARIEAEFDAAVQEGVSTLMAAATKAVRHVSARADRYRVAEDHPGEPPQSEPPRARRRP
jgi:NAD(P)-dependent dehydrogenase (short-subunit alcohol dehydrogenase family)